MTMLPSPGSRYIEPDGKSAPMVTATVLHLAADGIYDLVVAGTAPSAPRIRSCRIGGGSNVILY
jgi:hypothetical protein